LGTALGIALMTVLLSISGGMDKMMNDMMTELAGGIGVYPADNPLAFMTGGGTPFSISYVDDIEEIDHVESVRPMALWFIPTPKNEADTFGADFSDPLGVSLRGVDLTQDAELDEPTGNLDTKTGMDILNLLQRLNEKGRKTLIVVTHDRRLADRAERVLYLVDGRLYDVAPEGI